MVRLHKGDYYVSAVIDDCDTRRKIILWRVMLPSHIDKRNTLRIMQQQCAKDCSTPPKKTLKHPGAVDNQKKKKNAGKHCRATFGKPREPLTACQDLDNPANQSFRVKHRNRRHISNHRCESRDIVDRSVSSETSTVHTPVKCHQRTAMKIGESHQQQQDQENWAHHQPHDQNQKINPAHRQHEVYLSQPSSMEQFRALLAFIKSIFSDPLRASDFVPPFVFAPHPPNRDGPEVSRLSYCTQSHCSNSEEKPHA